MLGALWHRGRLWEGRAGPGLTGRVVELDEAEERAPAQSAGGHTVPARSGRRKRQGPTAEQRERAKEALCGAAGETETERAPGRSRGRVRKRILVRSSRREEEGPSAERLVTEGPIAELDETEGRPQRGAGGAQPGEGGVPLSGLASPAHPRCQLHSERLSLFPEATNMERKRTTCPSLPTGWKKEEVIRKSGLSAGKSDIYYYR